MFTARYELDLQIQFRILWLLKGLINSLLNIHISLTVYFNALIRFRSSNYISNIQTYCYTKIARNGKLNFPEIFVILRPRCGVNEISARLGCEAAYIVRLGSTFPYNLPVPLSMFKQSEDTWYMDQQVVPKRRPLSTNLCCVTSQNGKYLQNYRAFGKSLCT